MVVVVVVLSGGSSVGWVGWVVEVVEDGGGAVVVVVDCSVVVDVGSNGSTWLRAPLAPPTSARPSRPLSSTASARRRDPADTIVRWRSP